MPKSKNFGFEFVGLGLGLVLGLVNIKDMKKKMFFHIRIYAKAS